VKISRHDRAATSFLAVVAAALACGQGTVDTRDGDQDAMFDELTTAETADGNATDADLPPDTPCMVAAFTATVGGFPVDEKSIVEVQSRLELHETCSDPAGGPVASREWTVKAPAGSAAAFQPSPYMPNVSFDANVPGEYEFLLTCTSTGGCSAWKTLTVEVTPPTGCHVELTWDTPLDPDQTDHCGTNADCGADMDLHVVHPDAQGPDIDKDGKPDGFFDVGQYDTGFAGDCMWFNPNPTWDKDNAGDPDHQPHIDLDDTDGGGPENFTYRFPEEGLCYRVGVYYADDHELGKSYPTLRVWMDGQPLYETTTAPKMSESDLWEVGEVCCSAMTFNEYKGADGGPLIIHNYVNPAFVQIAGGSCD
jgi:hypothetical protein